LEITQDEYRFIACFVVRSETMNVAMVYCNKDNY
jgi:hypothetical protein